MISVNRNNLNFDVCPLTAFSLILHPWHHSKQPPIELK